MTDREIFDEDLYDENMVVEGEDPKFYEDLLIKFMYIDDIVRDKVFPHINIKLFDRHENRLILEHIFKHIEKYEEFPTLKETKLSLMKINDNSVFDHFKIIYNLDIEQYKKTFLLSEMEEFLKQKMLQNISIEIMEKAGEADLEYIGEHPDKLREILSFSFDSNIGLNLFSLDAEERLFQDFHQKKFIVPTGITLFDEMIEDGFHGKSLSLFLAETNMGKSLIMNSLAVSNVFQNKKVLYISCELSEERTAERALANMFDMETKEVKMLSRKKFHGKYESLIEKFSDNFIIVEYPTKTINCNTLRNLLKELDMKLDFTPDIVYLDQIENLNPIHRAKSDNTYSEMKKVTADVRGIAVESGVPWVSAIQTNRDGMSSTEIDLTNVGDSIGFAQIADLIIAVTTTEELRAAGKLIWTVLKNRFGPNKRKMSVCVDYFKMRITNDDDAFVEFRSENDESPKSDSEQKQETTSVIDKVSSIMNSNDERDDKMVIDFDYD